MMIAAVDLLIFLLIMVVVACVGAICLFGYMLLQQCIIDEAEEDNEDFVKIDEDEGKA